MGKTIDLNYFVNRTKSKIFATVIWICHKWAKWQFLRSEMYMYMTGYHLLPLKEKPCSETVHWYGEESLSLGRVNIHSDHLVDPRHLQTHVITTSALSSTLTSSIPAISLAAIGFLFSGCLWSPLKEEILTSNDNVNIYKSVTNMLQTRSEIWWETQKELCPLTLYVERIYIEYLVDTNLNH